jgi:hypothetical protein
VEEANAGSLVLLRRTLFKYKGVTDRMNFINEPYMCGEFVDGAAPLLRASWTSKRYLGYAGRTVRMEYRLTDGPDSAWDNRFLDSAQTDDRGYVELYDFVGAAEEGPGGMLPDDGPPCGGTIVFRGHYGGNGTSSGTWSNGDAIAEATIDWEKYRPHLKEEIDAAAWPRTAPNSTSWARKCSNFLTRCCGPISSDGVCRPDAGRTTDRRPIRWFTCRAPSTVLGR